MNIKNKEAKVGYCTCVTVLFHGRMDEFMLRIFFNSFSICPYRYSFLFHSMSFFFSSFLRFVSSLEYCSYSIALTKKSWWLRQNMRASNIKIPSTRQKTVTGIIKIHEIFTDKWWEKFLDSNFKQYFHLLIVLEALNHHSKSKKPHIFYEKHIER